MIVRQILQTDNLSLAKMIRLVFEEHNAPTKGTVYCDPTTDNLYELFQLPNSVLWVAEVNNQAVGCCGIYPTEGLDQEYCELVKFYLAKDARGKGIGRELMSKCIHSAKEFGYTKMYIESLPEFDKAVNIYQKQGFTKIDKPLGSSGHNGCNIWMIKEL